MHGPQAAEQVTKHVVLAVAGTAKDSEDNSFCKEKGMVGDEAGGMLVMYSGQSSCGNISPDPKKFLTNQILVLIFLFKNLLCRAFFLSFARVNGEEGALPLATNGSQGVPSSGLHQCCSERGRLH